MNLTYLTFPDLPLTYPIFSGTQAFQISDSHFKNKKKMASLYVWERRSCYVGLLDFWPSSTYRSQGSQILKASIQRPSPICEVQHLFVSLYFLGPSLAGRKPVSGTIRRRNFQQVEVTIQAVRGTFTTCLKTNLKIFEIFAVLPILKYKNETKVWETLGQNRDRENGTHNSQSGLWHQGF